MLVNLMMLVILTDSGELVQVWTPDTQFQTMTACRNSAEIMLKIPLAPDRTALAQCVDQKTGEVWSKWYEAGR